MQRPCGFVKVARCGYLAIWLEPSEFKTWQILAVNVKWIVYVTMKCVRFVRVVTS